MIREAELIQEVNEAQWAGIYARSARDLQEYASVLRDKEVALQEWKIAEYQWLHCFVSFMNWVKDE